MHRVQRCGLLLHMFHGLSVCEFVRVSAGHSMSRAKTDEPVEMPFGLWTRVGPSNHVLGVSPVSRST